ncbi:GD18321 [Drosophila simulans]|uniref:GD18321 n=1 Tax=Drosophila simulans TaxID=7240 RepID=B4QSG9_DROSI|nr:GD18321 [Drosophila simulans]
MNVRDDRRKKMKRRLRRRRSPRADEMKCTKFRGTKNLQQNWAKFRIFPIVVKRGIPRIAMVTLKTARKSKRPQWKPIYGVQAPSWACAQAQAQAERIGVGSVSMAVSSSTSGSEHEAVLKVQRYDMSCVHSYSYFRL